MKSVFLCEVKKKSDLSRKIRFVFVKGKKERFYQEKSDMFLKEKKRFDL